MEAGLMTLLIVVVSITIGFIVVRYGRKKSITQGKIYVYYDKNRSKPSLLLEYGVPIDDIVSRKKVTFDVAVIREDSHQ